MEINCIHIFLKFFLSVHLYALQIFRSSRSVSPNKLHWKAVIQKRDGQLAVQRMSEQENKEKIKLSTVVFGPVNRQLPAQLKRTQRKKSLFFVAFSVALSPQTNIRIRCIVAANSTYKVKTKHFLIEI